MYSDMICLEFLLRLRYKEQCRLRVGEIGKIRLIVHLSKFGGS